MKSSTINILNFKEKIHFCDSLRAEDEVTRLGMVRTLNNYIQKHVHYDLHQRFLQKLFPLKSRNGDDESEHKEKVN